MSGVKGLMLVMRGVWGGSAYSAVHAYSTPHQHQHRSNTPPAHPQVTLLDPVRYPGSIKVFAREVCRNDLLNFGRLHFFFPDSRCRAAAVVWGRMAGCDRGKGQ